MTRGETIFVSSNLNVTLKQTPTAFPIIIVMLVKQFSLSLIPLQYPLSIISEIATGGYLCILFLSLFSKNNLPTDFFGKN